MERLKGEREASEHEVQDKDVLLRSALEKVNHHDSAAAVNDAHLWWAYIWHTLKQQQDKEHAGSDSTVGAGAGSLESKFVSQIGGMGNAGPTQPGSLEFSPEHDAAAAVHQSRMKDNLRAQAIEITQLRQV